MPACASCSTSTARGRPHASAAASRCLGRNSTWACPTSRTGERSRARRHRRRRITTAPNTPSGSAGRSWGNGLVGREAEVVGSGQPGPTQAQLAVIGIGQAGVVALVTAAMSPEHITRRRRRRRTASSRSALSGRTRMGLLAQGLLSVGDVPHLAALRTQAQADCRRAGRGGGCTDQHNLRGVRLHAPRLRSPSLRRSTHALGLDALGSARGGDLSVA